MSIMSVDIYNRFQYDLRKVTVIKNTVFPAKVDVTPTLLTTIVHTYIICIKKGNKPTNKLIFYLQRFSSSL